MAKKIQFRRMFWLALLLTLAFVGLGYRLADLQLVRHEKLKAEAGRNTQKEFLFEPRRGDILDAKGNLLATVNYVNVTSITWMQDCTPGALMGRIMGLVAMR